MSQDSGVAAPGSRTFSGAAPTPAEIDKLRRNCRWRVAKILLDPCTGAALADAAWKAALAALSTLLEETPRSPSRRDIRQVHQLIWAAEELDAALLSAHSRRAEP